MLFRIHRLWRKNLPHALKVTCTRKPELFSAMAIVIHQQMRSGGAWQGLSLLLDITLDPRWERAEETNGEDPYLFTTMGSQFVDSLQGDSFWEGSKRQPSISWVIGSPLRGRIRRHSRFPNPS